MHKKSRRRTSYRKRRGQDGRALKIAGLVTLPVLVAGISTAAMIHEMEKPQFDHSTYCYSDHINHEAAFFMDLSFTDDTSDQQHRDLDSALKKAYDALPANGRLSVFTTAKDSGRTLVEPVYTQCRPPATPKEQEKIPKADNTGPQLRRLTEEALTAFSKKASTLLEAAKDPSKIANDSPILETIREISRAYAPGQLKAFDLYTDGLQNTMLRRFCAVRGHLPAFEVFEKSPDYETVIKPNSMDGIRVNFYLVEFGQLPNQALPYCTNMELRQFWPEFLEDNGATVQLTPLRYGAGG